MRSLAIAILILAGGCSNTGPIHPYDQDVAHCRRAAAAPGSMSLGGRSGLFNGDNSTHVTTEDLLTGSGDYFFDACMRSRFAERFPGEPYPLDVRGRSGTQ